MIYLWEGIPIAAKRRRFDGLLWTREIFSFNSRSPYRIFHDIFVSLCFVGQKSPSGSNEKTLPLVILYLIIRGACALMLISLEFHRLYGEKTLQASSLPPSLIASKRGCINFNAGLA